MPDPICACYSSAMCEESDDDFSPFSAARGSDAPVMPPESTDATTAGVVLLCRRVAELPLADSLGLEHWWLMTADREAGMGACGEGVPGNRFDSPYLTETCLNDHGGQHERPDVQCHPLHDVDASCIDRYLEEGRPLGAWSATNQCQSFVEDLVEACVPKATDSFEGAEGAPGQYDTGPR